MRKKTFAVMLLSVLILGVYCVVSWAAQVTCWKCSGTGKQNCGICHGSGVCPTCNGKRRYYIPSYGTGSGSYVNCQGCYGSGKCWRCNGSRKETCHTCGGSGYTYGSDPTPTPDIDHNEPPSPNKDTLSGTPGTEYSDSISSGSGQSPYTWEITSGTLPTGITFASSGDKAVFSGTLADEEGTYKFTLKVTDANGKTGEKQITFKVYYPPLKISGWIPGDGSVGSEYCKPYGARFSADDGTEPYTWRISRGLIPPGMKVDTEGNGVNGVRIIGVPTSPDTYKFTLSVVDGKGRTAEKDLTLKVKGSRVDDGLYIDGEFPDVTIEPSEILRQYWKYDYYINTIYAKGGRGKYTWSVIAGSLPQGLETENKSYESEKFRLLGWPPEHESYADNEFILQVVDADGRTATKKFSVSVPEGKEGGSKNVKMPYTLPEITGSFADASEGKTYSGYVTAGKGTAPYTWSADVSNLPEGFTLACSDNTTGKASGLTGKYAHISGTPSYGGRYGDITLKVTDANGNTTAKSFIFKVVQKPTISGTLDDAIRKGSYTGQIRVNGGTAPYAWNVSAGSLPDGLNVKASGDIGVISGKPSKAGQYSFMLKVSDKNGLTASKAFDMEITQTAITGTLAGSVTRKATYSGYVKAEGGTSPYVWSVSEGKLPEGLNLTASGDKADITGTAAKAGTYKFTLKAKDKNGAAGTKAYTVKVTQTAVKGDIPATVTRRATFTGTPKASGGTSPYSWSISAGKLPDGLKLNASTGKITGSPSKAGTFNFTVKAKDKSGAAGTKSYTVKVTQTAVKGDIPTSITRKATFTGTPKASGGASPYSWSVSAGKLPDGLKLNSSTGKITGSPSKAGTFNFTLKAKDKNGAAGTKAYTVKVTQTKVTGTLANAVKGTSYTATPKASNGASPYAWSVSSGNFPKGLKLNSSTGKITGTPSKTGSYTFTLKAKDKNGAAGTKNFTVKVTAPTTKSAIPESKSSNEDDSGISAQAHNTVSALPVIHAPIIESVGSTVLTLTPSLRVISEDALEVGEGRDSDLFTVKAGHPLTFILGAFDVEASDWAVYVDDERIEGVIIFDEGIFTLPPEFVSGDFKVQVKSLDGNHESEQAFIISE